MIKGINKNVIEVSDVESVYYDKAILFIKPQFADIGQEMLEVEAKKILGNIDVTSSIKSKRRMFEKAMIIICTAAVTATLCLVFLC